MESGEKRNLDGTLYERGIHLDYGGDYDHLPLSHPILFYIRSSCSALRRSVCLGSCTLLLPSGCYSFLGRSRAGDRTYHSTHGDYPDQSVWLSYFVAPLCGTIVSQHHWRISDILRVHFPMRIDDDPVHLEGKLEEDFTLKYR